MKFQYVPLLGIQQSIYKLPPSQQRFETYLDIMMETTPTGNRGNDLEYAPLVNMNPMANNEIMLPILERYQDEFNVDTISSNIVNELEMKYSSSGGSSFSSPYTKEYEDLWKVGMVLVDDANGSWTNYVDVEYTHLFDTTPKMYQRGWIDVILWSSQNMDVVTTESISDNVESCIHRFIYQNKQKQQQSSIIDDYNSISELCLHDMLDQESWVWEQVLLRKDKSRTNDDILNENEKDKINHSIRILKENGHVTDYPTIIAGLFGDDAAIQCGHPSLSLGTKNKWNGLELCKYGLWK